ncbi:MAG: hypothetical protein PHW95_02515 [Patescibacteria group bacterium]|nr:hypothetical protein [Patescibacteria group bacterium]
MIRAAVVEDTVRRLSNEVPFDKVDEVSATIGEALRKQYLVFTVPDLLEITKRHLDILRQRFDSLIAEDKATCRGGIDSILARLEATRNIAISEVAGKPMVGVNLPLLPVISSRFLAASIQVNMISHGNDVGLSLLDDAEILDEFVSENGAWWLTNVETGRQFSDGTYSQEDQESVVIAQDRKVIMAAEAIALGVHFPKVFKANNVVALGSRLRSTIGQAIILANELGSFRLRSMRISGDAKYGVASCKSRI